MSGDRSPFEGSCCGSSAVSSDDEAQNKLAKFRIVLLGAAGVGKSALVSQFMTSEYINTYDVSLGKWELFFTAPRHWVVIAEGIYIHNIMHLELLSPCGFW